MESIKGQFVTVGTKTDVQDLEGGKLVVAGGQQIAILDLGGSFYAVENTSPTIAGCLT